MNDTRHNLSMASLAPAAAEIGISLRQAMPRRQCRIRSKQAERMYPTSSRTDFDVVAFVKIV